MKTISTTVSRHYKWEMIALLWFAFFLNQGDRQIYNVVMPLIGADLKLDAVQLGLVATIFMAVYGVLVPLAGYAGDVFSRKWMVFASLAIFSVGTVLTGVANGILLLVFFRSIATGAGEAFYYPAANALIGEFHSASRARAMAIHQTANYTGVVVAGFLAAWIGEKWGWRMSFLTFGFAGIAWAALAGFGFFRGLYDSNLMAAPFDVIPPKYRASATGLMLSCGFFIGSAAPVALGWMKIHLGLGRGLSALGLVYVLSAVLIFIALKCFFHRDYHVEQPEISHA